MSVFAQTERSLEYYGPWWICPACHVTFVIMDDEYYETSEMREPLKCPKCAFPRQD